MPENYLQEVTLLTYQLQQFSYTISGPGQAWVHDTKHYEKARTFISNCHPCVYNVAYKALLLTMPVRP